MKFRIINKSDSKIISKGNPDDVALYLLGRNLDNYIIVKSDLLGDRTIPLANRHRALQDFAEILKSS
jgi:hypothetical protein